MSEMADKEEGRAGRLYDDIIKELEGEKEAAPAAPVLPRLRLTTPSSKAPLTIKKKFSGAQAPLVAAAQLLPEIMRQVDEARKAQAEARSRKQSPAARAAVDAAPLVVPVGEPAPPKINNSRVAWRYALVFGKRIDRVWKGRARQLAEDHLEDKAIYTVRGQESALRVPSHFWETRAWTGWAFLLPALIAFTLFSWLPLLRGLVASFQHVSLSGASSWVGLDNYVRAFSDPQVWATFGHALLFCVLSLALGFWLPVALALYTNEVRKGQSFLKFVFFLPFLTPAVPAVVLWRWILDQGYGLLNSMLSAIPGLGPVHIPWLNHPFLAMLSVVLVFLWKNTGWNALIYMTALREIPEELYETAELDGASLLTRIRVVSLPFLRSTMGFLLLMQVIATFQIFTEVYLLTGGGPMNSTEMIATYMYKKSFLYLDIGYAAALGVTLFLVLLSFTAARLRALEEES